MGHTRDESCGKPTKLFGLYQFSPLPRGSWNNNLPNTILDMMMWTCFLSWLHLNTRYISPPLLLTGIFHVRSSLGIAWDWGYAASN